VAFIDTNNTFSDIAVTSRLTKVNSFLKELDTIINFEELRPLLNKNGVAKSNVAGAPAYDNVLMFKVLLLQKYYNLSDQATEDAFYVNLLFIRFVGLSLEDSVPDESTICRFRNSLLKHKLYDKLFDSVNRQLEAKDLIAKTGKSILVDASLIKSNNTQIKNKTKEQRKEDKAEVKKINTDLDTLQGIDTKNIQTSKDSINNEEDSYNHTKKIDTEIRIGYQSSKKQYTQGYKIHIAVDEASGVILKPQVTFANTADIDAVKGFVEDIKNIDSFYADKAYKSKETDELLENKNINNMICLKEKQTLAKEQILQQRKDEKPKHGVPLEGIKSEQK